MELVKIIGVALVTAFAALFLRGTKIIVKIVAIGYLVEFSAGVIEDFGSKSIADKLILAGKVIIFAVSVPIIRSMLELIGGFLELL